MELETRLEITQHYLEAQYPLLLLTPKDKSPWVKGWRGMDFPPNRVLAHVKTGGNIGWKLQKNDLVIDVDPRNFELGDNPLDRLTIDYDLEIILDKAPKVLTGSGGIHFYCSIPDGLRIKNTIRDKQGNDIYRGVEFKSFGRQVVIPGSIHPNGTAYLLDPLTFDLKVKPTVPDTLLQDISKHEPIPRVLPSKDAALTPPQLETVLALLDPEDYREHEDWLRLMMACHAATNGLGQIEFVDWSVSDPMYRNHKDIVTRRWDSLKHHIPSGITVGTLYKAVLDAGKQIPNFVKFDDISKEAVPLTEEQILIDEINSSWCLVFSGKNAVIYHDVFNPILNKYGWTKFNQRDFQTYWLNKPRKIGKEEIMVGSWWLSHPKRREAEGIIFDPECTSDSMLNLWKGFSVTPKIADWSFLDDLIRYGITQEDEQSYEYLLNWIAYLFQKPGERSEVATVLRGKKGSGKGTLANAILKILFSHSIPVSTPEHFIGRFNSHLQECAFLFVDEAFWAGSHQAESTLKQLITEPTIFYEGKGVDGMIGKNCLSIMIASNAEWVVPAGLDMERRFFVLDVTDTFIENKTFWDNLYEQLNKGGLSGFLYDMQQRDLRGWHPRENVPQTEALAEQKKQTMEDIAKWWYTCLHDGTLNPDIDSLKWEDEKPLKVQLEKLFMSYRNDMVSRNIRHQYKTKPGFCKTLSSFGAVISKERKRNGIEYTLHPLKTCRENFEQHLGYPQQWD